jgi:hypothetical protein
MRDANRCRSSPLTTKKLVDRSKTNDASSTEQKKARLRRGPCFAPRLDGLDLDEGMKAIYWRYIAGDLTLAELGNEIDDRAKREFGARNLGRPSRC